jgi:hypothetical protein
MGLVGLAVACNPGRVFVTAAKTKGCVSLCLLSISMEASAAYIKGAFARLLRL